jgi:hypothetical protein
VHGERAPRREQSSFSTSSSPYNRHLFELTDSTVMERP